MKYLKFFLAVLVIWLLTQVIVWGFAEMVLDDHELAHVLGLEEIDPYLKILVYTLFPLPFALVLACRLVKGRHSED